MGALDAMDDRSSTLVGQFTIDESQFNAISFAKRLILHILCTFQSFNHIETSILFENTRKTEEDHRES